MCGNDRRVTLGCKHGVRQRAGKTDLHLGQE